jgi:LCP family protein required for cell wall assembly
MSEAPAGPGLPPALNPRTPPAKARPGRARRVRWRRVLTVAGGLGALVLVAAAIVAYRLYGQIHRVNIRFAVPAGHSGDVSAPGAQAAPTAADGSQNFLLMGSDSRDFSGGNAYNVGPGSAAHVTGQRSDVVMLLHIPSGAAKAVVVSFPRDSWVELPSYTDTSGGDHVAVHAKLNAAFALGGAPLLVATMEQLTGLRIDHFAAVNFPGFQGMVDTLGGINVCVRTGRHDANSGDFLTAGDHHLNGVQALALVRDRESFPNQDLGRIKDQEYFLSVMLHSVLSAGTLTNPVKLTEFLDVATKSLTVDSGLSINDMRKLASRFSRLDPAHVSFQTVPIANANYRATSSVYGNQPQSNVEIDPAGGAQLFAALAGNSNAAAPPAVSSSLAATSVSVRVENATSTSGLAQATANQLRALGFRVVSTGNAPGGASPATFIAYGAGDLAAAQTLQAHVPGATLQPATSASEVVLTLGADFTAVSPTPATPRAPPEAAPTALTPVAAPDLSCAP